MVKALMGGEVEACIGIWVDIYGERPDARGDAMGV